MLAQQSRSFISFPLSLPAELFALSLEYLILEELLSIDSALEKYPATSATFLHALRLIRNTDKTGFLTDALDSDLISWVMSRDLSVTFAKFRTFNAITLRYLTKFRDTLAEINFSGCRFTDSTVLEIGPFPNLKNLHLGRSSVTKDRLENFLKHHEQLEQLGVLEADDVFPSDTLSMISTHCPNLRCLNLGCNFSCEDADVTAFLSTCPKLQLLSIPQGISTETRLTLLRNLAIPLLMGTGDPSLKALAIETIYQFVLIGS
jgi:hypothetical protein